MIGINSQIYSRTGGYMGVSFAIPIDVALNVEDQLVKTGKVDARPHRRDDPGSERAARANPSASTVRAARWSASREGRPGRQGGPQAR